MSVATPDVEEDTLVDEDVSSEEKILNNLDFAIMRERGCHEDGVPPAEAWAYVSIVAPCGNEDLLNLCEDCWKNFSTFPPHFPIKCDACPVFHIKYTFTIINRY